MGLNTRTYSHSLNPQTIPSAITSVEPTVFPYLPIEMEMKEPEMLPTITRMVYRYQDSFPPLFSATARRPMQRRSTQERWRSIPRRLVSHLADFESHPVGRPLIQPQIASVSPARQREPSQCPCPPQKEDQNKNKITTLFS